MTQVNIIKCYSYFLIYSKKFIYFLKNKCHDMIEKDDLEGYFLYLITDDDSDARFSNNLNIQFKYFIFFYIYNFIYIILYI